MLSLEPSPRARAILAGQPALAGQEHAHRSILRRVLAMGLPSVASFLLLTVYDLIDIFWLARLGEEPVAAVTVFAAFQWVLTFSNQIIGTGSVAVISRRFGEGDASGTERAIKATFLGKLLVGIFGAAIGIPLLPHALALLGAAPEVAALGVRYGTIQCAALGLSLASFSVYTALRGVGRPALGMWISVIGTVVNLVLDPLLIFGVGPFPRLGIAGAAVASVAGFTTVTACGLLALGSARSPVRVRWLGAPHTGPGDILRIARIGLPSGIGALSVAITSSVVVKLVATFGTSVVALFGMSQKVLHLGIMVIAGLGLGTSALIGQYLGARQLRNAWIASVLTMRLGAGAMVGFGGAVAVAAPWIVHLFFDDPTLAAPGALYLRIMAISLPFLGIVIGAEQAYVGAGRNKPPMLMHMAIGWGMVIPLMALLGHGLGFGPAGMLAGMALGDALGALLGIALVRHGTWLTHGV